jgi:micrococcal nuclease
MRPLAMQNVLFVLLAALTLPASAADLQKAVISGPVRVIDGDTIVLTNTNTHVRLNGVDAPEVVHPGYDHDDAFGPESREEMRSIIGGAVVRCELNGERSYERVVGVCYLPDGTDIGAEIIRRGLALDCARWSFGRYRSLEPDGVRDVISQEPYCQPR